MELVEFDFILELILVLFFAIKTVHFFVFKGKHWSIRNFLYFSHHNISMSSDPKKAKAKKFQNAFSVITGIALLFFLVIKLIFRPAN